MGATSAMLSWRACVPYATTRVAKSASGLALGGGRLSTGSIKGGQTKTDRVVRTVVFPSYGVDDPNTDAVMIASYTWSQDAARVGGLMNGRNTADEQFLIDNILKDLAALHDVTFDFLKNELQD